MKWATAVALTALLAGQFCDAATKKHVTKNAVPAHSSTHVAPRGAVTGSRRQSSSHIVSARSRGKARRYSRAASGPAAQAHPDPERYQQIQQALAERGYYKGELNGEWNADSSDALKRFQTDQKLEPDGKINSLSLINLGLGPKHEGNAVASATATPNETPPSTPSN